MRRLKVIPHIYLLVILMLFLIPLAFSKENDFKEVEQLRDDIQIINLLNNLNLRQSQMEFILQKARQAQAIRNSVQEKVNSYKTEMASACSAIKEEVESGKVIVDKPNASKFHAIKKEIERLTHQAYDDINKIASSVEASLEEFQLLALDSYKPCIIPIIKNGRIGQAEGSKGIVKVLERVRSISQERYDIMKDTLAQRILEKEKLKLPPNVKFDEAQAKAEIFNIFAKARTMEEVEFGLNKESLADELKTGIAPEKPTMARSDKIKRFLLSENIIPILEKKISESNKQQ